MSWTGTTTVQNNNTADTIALNNGGTLADINPSNWVVLLGAVTNSGSGTITISSNATGSATEGFFMDGGLKGTGTVTINATNAGSGVNFRNNNSTFSGLMIVNGIASTTAFSGSGIGVGGNTTGLQNADIQLNGTMELLTGGLGWANSASGVFKMGALSGTGVMIGNFSGGGITTVTVGTTNNSGNFSGIIANGTGNTVNLVKIGTGTQTLSGSNTYTGATSVNAGTLLVTGSLGTTAITVGNTGSSTTGILTINTASTLALTQLVEGQSIGDAGTVNMNGGTLNFSSFFDIGNSGTALTSTYNQTAGTVTVAGQTYVGNGGQANFTISGGTYTANGGFGFNVAPVGSPSSTVTLSGGTLTVGSITTGGGTSTFNFNGGTLKARAASASFMTGLTTANVQANSTINNGGFGITIGQNLLNGTAGAGLTFQGAGTTTLTGTSTFNGGTAITAGSLIVSGTGALLGNTAISTTGTSTFAALPGTGSISLGTTGAGSAGATLNLGSGTIFSMTDAAAGLVNLQQQTSFVGTALTINTDTLNFDATSTGADQLAVTGAASVSGTNIIGISTTGVLSTGTKTLISAASGLTGTFQFAGGATAKTVVSGGTPFALVLGNSSTAETLTVTNLTSTALTWTGQTAGNGAANSTWDTTGTPTNWATGSTPINYLEGAAVTFQDTNTVTTSNVTNGTVTIQAAGVNPFSVLFNNSAVNYTVGNASGSVGMAGTMTLTKSGTGTVTFISANTYTGGSIINNGMLQIGNGTTNGTANGTYAIGSSGVLKFNYNTSGGTTPIWANISGAGKLELATAKTFDTTSFASTNITLPNTFTGTLQIDGGRVVPTGPSGLGNAANIIINNGGQLALYSFSGTLTQNLTIAGTGYGEGGYESAIRLEGRTISGNIALSANATLASSSGSVLSGVISGGSGSTLSLGTSAQASTIFFYGSNTYTGATVINNGTLQIGDGTTGHDGTLLSSGITTNSALNFNTFSSQSFAGTISGNGFTKNGAGTLNLSGAARMSTE